MRSGSGEIARFVSRGAFWLGLEKVAALLSGVAYSVLLLRWLGPTKFGIMTIALACVGFATTATGNLEMYLERYAAEYQAQGRRRTLRRAHLLALGIKLGLGVVAGTALLALTPWLAGFFTVPELRILVPVLTVMVLLDGLSTTGRATLFGTQQFRTVSLLAIGFHVAKTVLVGLLWWTRHGVVSLAVGLAALTTLQAFAQAAFALRGLRGPDRGPQEPERGWGGLLREMIGYSVPLLGGRIAFLSGQNLSKFILGKLFDAAALGYFTFAFQTIERFNEVVNTLPSSLLPSLTQLVARGERERLRLVFDQAQRMIQALACMVSIGIFLFAREITLLIGSPLFEPAIPMLRVLALVPIARTAQQPFTALFQAMRKPGTVMRLAVAKVAAEFGSYFVLVLPLGIIGAAWANLTGAAVSYALALVLLARLLPEGGEERGRVALTAVALFLPVAGVVLAIEAFVHGLVLVPIHGLLALVAGVGLFATGLLRREDMDKLATMPIERAWACRLRDGVVLVLGLFARLAGVRRAA
jgi:PST family polysaccharide transporter/lipopolysaccharide exporter